MVVIWCIDNHVVVMRLSRAGAAPPSWECLEAPSEVHVASPESVATPLRHQGAVQAPSGSGLWSPEPVAPEPLAPEPVATGPSAEAIAEAVAEVQAMTVKELVAVLRAEGNTHTGSKDVLPHRTLVLVYGLSFEEASAQQEAWRKKRRTQ